MSSTATSLPIPACELSRIDCSCLFQRKQKTDQKPNYLTRLGDLESGYRGPYPPPNMMGGMYGGMPNMMQQVSCLMIALSSPPLLVWLMVVLCAGWVPAKFYARPIPTSAVPTAVPTIPRPGMAWVGHTIRRGVCTPLGGWFGASACLFVGVSSLLLWQQSDDGDAPSNASHVWQPARRRATTAGDSI